MIVRPLLALALVLSPAAALAAERKLYVASFDRVRVQGPFDVRIASGSANGTLSGDKDVIDGVEVRVDGSTLVVRTAIGTWQEQPRAKAGEATIVTLSTPMLVGASVTGAGRLTIARMKGPRVDLSVTGNGAIAVAAVDTDSAIATLIGDGSIALAGRAGKARLMTNGGGTIDAGALDAGDLIVRVDGLGSTKAQARYTATVSNTGLGQITIGGSPKCVVKSDAGGPVTCGPAR